VNKVIPLEQAVHMVREGATVMINGFMSVKTPDTLIDGLVAEGVGNLTVISNDASVPGKGIGKLLTAGLIRKLVTSHIGLNPEAATRMHAGSLEVELIPQGTLVERIRCGGAGLGGVLTPTGVGTSVQEGKQVILVDGKEYLLEKPMHADVTLLRGSVVDTLGNVYYRGTTKNFSLVMAMAADLVIAEAEKLVEPGEIDPDLVMTPCLFVDYIVVAGGAQ
jgi:acetate CoA/acetoacetate CoA-transferase alpha subunit